ncbi:EVE domain-containing protein, partial [Candidatus Gracilibacteria bacterium]|nr:EVE domain-containing protein [Candidatus Gracilibacteria bacterium]
VGLMRVASEALPDMTALDINNEHYDPKSTLKNPIWITRTMEFVEKFKEPIPLTTLKNDPELSQMVVAQKGSRLSITPVSNLDALKLIRLSREF